MYGSLDLLSLSLHLTAVTYVESFSKSHIIIVYISFLIRQILFFTHPGSQRCVCSSHKPRYPRIEIVSGRWVHLLNQT